MKRIVAVIFEDGTEAAVADMQTIVRYVNSFRVQQGVRALASDPRVDWPAVAMQAEQRQAHRLEVRAKKRGPRGKGKDVTPEKALETLERIVAGTGTRWGAAKEAAKELGVSKRTLNRRTKNSAT